MAAAAAGVPEDEEAGVEVDDTVWVGPPLTLLLTLVERDVIMNRLDDVNLNDITQMSARSTFTHNNNWIELSKKRKSVVQWATREGGLVCREESRRSR